MGIGTCGRGVGRSLGLSIVRAHRGQVTARALAEGGLTVEVSLPRRQRPA